MFEIKEILTNIKEHYPLQVGNTILHLSKLLMSKFVTFLIEHLEEDEFRFVYTGVFFKILYIFYALLLDTDSLCCVMTDSMDKIVKPKYRSNWDTIRKMWFVINESDPYETRLPGKMKTEWETRNGSIIW